MAEGIAQSWAQAPGPTEAPELIRRVARYVLMQDSEEGRGVALDGIHEAENDINKRLWRFLLTSQTIALTGALTYTLQANFKAPRAAELLDSGGSVWGTVGYYDPKSFEAMFPWRAANSTLTGYTVFNDRDDGLLSVNGGQSSYPTLKLWYYRRLQTMTDAAATPLTLPREAESFIYWKAAAFTASVYDTTKYALAASEAERAWTMLSRDDFRAQLSDWS